MYEYVPPCGATAEATAIQTAREAKASILKAMSVMHRNRKLLVIVLHNVPHLYIYLDHPYEEFSSRLEISRLHE